MSSNILISKALLQCSRRLETMGTCLGLDIGLKRIGLAMGVPRENRVIPLDAVIAQSPPSKRSFDTISRINLMYFVPLVDRLKHLCEQQEIRHIVVGYPLLPNGVSGRSCTQIQSMVEKLDETLDACVDWIYWDERHSSRIARQFAEMKNVQIQGDKRSHLDSLAATLILQSFFDTCQHSKTSVQDMEHLLIEQEQAEQDLVQGEDPDTVQYRALLRKQYERDQKKRRRR